MARVTRHASLDQAALEQVLRPRDGVVLERALGDGRFEAAEGPVSGYRREITATPTGDGTFDVRQVVAFDLALPWFWWVFLPLVRPHLGQVAPPGRLPWWAPPARLDARASTSLATVMGLAVVVGYTGYLLSTTMTYAADDFGVGTTAQGIGLAAGRFDLLVSLPLLAFADRRGRRPMLQLGVTGACVLSALGALAPNLPALMATQVPARGFGTAAAIVIGIVAAEEMPAGSRAWSLSLLAFAGATGVAICLGLLFLAQVATWRLMYVVALAGLPMLRALGRRLVESRRFAAPHPDAAVAGHGGRLWLLAVSLLLLNMFLAPGSQFQNEFLKDERGYTAVKISLFLAATNVFGAVGVVVGGRLADLRGRRGVGAVAVAGGTLCTVLMYNAAGWPLWLWSTVGAIVGAATIPALGVYGPELFPTGLRGWANGLITALGRVGSVIGLVTAGVLADRLGTLGPALTILAAAPMALAVLIIVAYPETAGRELEDLNPEDKLP